MSRNTENRVERTGIFPVTGKMPVLQVSPLK